MDEVIKCASETDLSKDEHKVLLLVMLGAQTPFDIQKKTKWRIGRCETALEGVSCKIFAVLYKYNIANKTTVRSTGAKSLHHITKELLDELNSSLGRDVKVSYPPRDVAGMKASLNAALKATSDYSKAARLLNYYIHSHVDKLKHSDYPANYLATIFGGYVKAIPKMPMQIYERAQAKNLTFMYNDLTKQWEQV